MNLKLKCSIQFSACVLMREIGKEIGRTEADVCKCLCGEFVVNFVCMHAVFEKVFLKTLHDEEVSHLLHLSE